MGYSMTVSFESTEEKERMKSFLEANKEILNNLKNNKPYEPHHENTPFDGDNLGYTPNKKNLLGFYGSGIPSYIWDLCAWMAVKSQVRDKNNLPYIYYDSDKQIVTFDKSDKKNTLVDSEGFRIKQEFHSSIPKKVIAMLMGSKKEQENQKELMEQLNKNWNEYINSISPLTTAMKVKP